MRPIDYRTYCNYCGKLWDHERDCPNDKYQIEIRHLKQQLTHVMEEFSAHLEACSRAIFVCACKCTECAACAADESPNPV